MGGRYEAELTCGIDDDDFLYDDDFPECDHCDGYEIDLLDGRWSCDRCGFSRPSTTEEVENYIQWTRDYYARMDREYRRERLLAPWRWLRDLFRPKHSGEMSDDELPF